MSRFCVFTPTFNRKDCLPILYGSLKRQTFKDFTWTIVDDGSTDGTESIVNGFISEGLLNIKYLKQERNGGKQRASNRAVLECEDDLFFGVDSDDWLVDNALETLNRKWKTIEGDSSVAGMMALHGSAENEPIGSKFPANLKRTNYIDLYGKYHFKGDATHVYRTEVYKRYLYPVVDGELFISECIVLERIALKYDVLLINDVLKIGTYREDGLTSGSFELIKRNPKGYRLVKEQSARLSKTPTMRLYHVILYSAACMMGGEKGMPMLSFAPISSVLAFVPAKILMHSVFR